MVFCGSAVGAVSAKVGAPYAGPGNKFWPMLHKTGLTPRLMRPDEFRDLPALGIGLTDLAKYYSGADAGLRPDDDDVSALIAKIERHRPCLLAFNGKRAATRVLGRCGYGEQPNRLAGARVFVLPSTSGLAVRFWDEAPWFALAAAAKRETPGTSPGVSER